MDRSQALRNGTSCRTKVGMNRPTFNNAASPIQDKRRKRETDRAASPKAICPILLFCPSLTTSVLITLLSIPDHSTLLYSTIISFSRSFPRHHLQLIEQRGHGKELRKKVMVHNCLSTIQSATCARETREQLVARMINTTLPS